MSQVTVISGLSGGGSEPDEQKLALVEATLAPGANVAEIALGRISGQARSTAGAAICLIPRLRDL
jgi:hypothetical protein